MKSNPTKVLKILKGSYKVANENGILPEFKFYYSVKSLTIDGFFKKGELQRFSDNIGVSPNHINKLLSKTVKAGFIRKENGGYQLISYDAFWSMLGYDLTNRNNFRIIRVLSSNDFLDELYTKEIQINLKSQEAKVKEKTIESLPSLFDAENVPKKLQNRLLKQVNYKVEMRNNLLKIRKNDFNDNFTNYDITLSCQGISNLFGYNSKAQGFKLKNRLKAKGLLKVVAQPPVFVSNQILREQLEFMKEDEPNNKYLNRIFINKSGNALMRRCDLIEVNEMALEMLYSPFNRIVNIHSTTKGGTCPNSTAPRGKKEKETVYAYNNSIVDKNTNSSINIINKNSSNINSEHILNNSSNTSSILLGKPTVNEYLYHSKLKGYNSNIGNRVLHVRKADQYYVNPITLRIGKIE